PAKAVRDLTDDVKAEIKTGVDALSKKDASLGDAASKAQTGSSIVAVKPGDGSAREQAASCQRVLGASANIANEYATKRYRSNLINWGMLPFIYKDGDKNLPFANDDYVFIPGVKKMGQDKLPSIKAYAVKKDGTVNEFELTVGDLTDDERKIILSGCLINYYRN
ncbi:MAG: hydratase, partial [Treponema sp.]|nr:hydratase [Treponema sp.]